MINISRRYLPLCLILMPIFATSSHTVCINSTGNEALDQKIITVKIRGEISASKGKLVSSMAVLEQSENKTSDRLTERILLESSNEVGPIELENKVIKKSQDGGELVCMTGNEKGL